MSESPQNGTVLLIEDDDAFARSIKRVLEGEGFTVTHCNDGAEGLSKAVDDSFDVILTDFRLPGLGGMDVIDGVLAEKPLQPVILMTAHGNTELAIEATKRGAFDYIIKPFDLDDVHQIIVKAARSGRHMSEKPVTMGADAERASKTAIVGSSRAMQEVYKEIGKIAPTTASVLIRGETGTGKELIARAIYQHSERANAPFIAVNCGAIPENLLESELFGHVRGAFTGAVANRVGRFEQAHGGTLFLDEIGDMPLATQVKILRVLQESAIQPLGGTSEMEVDVRIVAATHQDLEARIAENEFREDLFYRLNTIVINLPPLRERTEDLGLLVEYFIDRAAAEYGMSRCPVPDTAIEAMGRYTWPGNVRQLENVLRAAVLNLRGRAVTPEYLNEVLEDAPLTVSQANGSPTLDELVRGFLADAQSSSEGAAHARLIAEAERTLISQALTLSHGHLGRVTEWLGISRVTLRQKLAKYDLDPRKRPESG